MGEESADAAWPVAVKERCALADITRVQEPVHFGSPSLSSMEPGASFGISLCFTFSTLPTGALAKPASQACGEVRVT